MKKGACIFHILYYIGDVNGRMNLPKKTKTIQYTDMNTIESNTIESTTATTAAIPAVGNKDGMNVKVKAKAKAPKAKAPAAKAKAKVTPLKVTGKVGALRITGNGTVKQLAAALREKDDRPWETPTATAAVNFMVLAGGATPTDQFEDRGGAKGRAARIYSFNFTLAK